MGKEERRSDNINILNIASLTLSQAARSDSYATPLFSPSCFAIFFSFKKKKEKNSFFLLLTVEEKILKAKLIVPMEQSTANKPARDEKFGCCPTYSLSCWFY